MKKWNSGVILILVLIMAGITLLAQTKSDSRKELEKKKEQLQQEIEETNKLLKLNQKNKNLTQAQLQQLNKKINAREELIRTINSELNELSGEINKTGREINSLNVQLDSLKMAYAAMIRFAYKNENKQSQMSYVFSADDFNQAVKRMKYLQEYSRHRQHQAALIGATKNVLNEKKGELEVQVKEKTSLKSNEEAERKNLTSEKKEQEVLMKNLTKQEATLRKQLAEKQAKKKKLDSAIEAAIKKEIEAAKKKAVAAGKKNVTKENAKIGRAHV